MAGHAAANRRQLVVAVRHRCGRVRRVEADRCTSWFPERVEKRSPAAADVEHRSEAVKGAGDEPDMVVENELAIHFREPARGGIVRRPPVGRGVKAAQFRGTRHRVQTNQPAVTAFDDVEVPLGGSVQPVGGAKQREIGLPLTARTSLPISRRERRGDHTGHAYRDLQTSSASGM